MFNRRKQPRDTSQDYVKVTVISHPTTGAQEWLGNTKHMWDEMLQEFAQRWTEGLPTQPLNMYHDGDRSSRPYYWATEPDGHFAEFLYGPVFADVTGIRYPAPNRIVAEMAMVDPG